MFILYRSLINNHSRAVGRAIAANHSRAVGRGRHLPQTANQIPAPDPSPAGPARAGKSDRVEVRHGAARPQRGGPAEHSEMIAV